MAERSAIFQSTQIGLETTPGTAVAAGKRLLSVGFSMSPNPDIKKKRPSGYKYPTLAVLNRESTELGIEGGLTYTEIVYLLAGAMKKVTPTGATTKTWTFDPSTTLGDTVATYTIEQGDSVRARKAALGLITELSFSFSREDITVGGSVIAGAMQDNITLTESPTEIALVPVMGPDVAVYLADTYAGLAAASPLDRPISVEWSLGNRFGPAWYLNQQVGFNAYVELEPSLTLSLQMASDAEGMAFLAPMRTGSTRFLRIEATGPVIGAGPDTYKLTLDTAVKVTDIGDFSEVEGIEAIEWQFEGFHSTEMGGATKAVVINNIAAL